MSETIFLEPVGTDKKTIWLDVKNTSDQEIDLSGLVAAVTAKGYRVVTDPEQGHDRLQANVLYVGKASQAAIDGVLGAGYGGPLVGLGVGAVAGAAIGQTPTGVGIGAAAGGIIGGAVEAVSGALVKAVIYAVVTDIQFSERSATPIAQEQSATLTQGTQTQVRQQVAETTNWKRYRTRIASSAIQVNLAFEEAKPQLIHGLIKSMSGIL